MGKSWIQQRQDALAKRRNLQSKRKIATEIGGEHFLIYPVNARLKGVQRAARRNNN